MTAENTRTCSVCGQRIPGGAKLAAPPAAQDGKISQEMCLRCRIALAERAEQLLRDDAMWDVVSPAQLGVVTWAAVGASSEHHRAAAAALTNDGYASVTTTTIGGRSVLRLCTLNPRTTEDDIRGTLSRLAQYVAQHAELSTI